MSEVILSEFPPVCRDCGMPLDCQHQADGKGGSYIIVTCWNADCLLRTVTRSLATYNTISEAELDTYRVMNSAVLS